MSVLLAAAMALASVEPKPITTVKVMLDAELPPVLSQPIWAILPLKAEL
jgi:hypothetical protein